MNFATVVDRIRDDFEEMPTLELTMGQAVRFWGVGVDDCRSVLDALVDAGLLRWTARRTIIRADRAFEDDLRWARVASDNSVQPPSRKDISGSNS